MKFVSIPYNDFIYEIFIYEMLCEIFVREYSIADRDGTIFFKHRAIDIIIMIGHTSNFNFPHEF